MRADYAGLRYCRHFQILYFFPHSTFYTFFFFLSSNTFQVLSSCLYFIYYTHNIWRIQYRDEVYLCVILHSDLLYIHSDDVYVCGMKQEISFIDKKKASHISIFDVFAGNENCDILDEAESLFIQLELAGIGIRTLFNVFEWKDSRLVYRKIIFFPIIS